MTMIVFDLQCAPHGHRFEGWFGSSADFADQQGRGLVTCPTCGTDAVEKAVMAPNLGRKGNQLPAPAAARTPAQVPAAHANSGPPVPPELVKAFRALAEAQALALKSSRWVGEDFAEKAREMHYGEAEMEAIHGKATLEEAQELAEEGVTVAPILFPVVPPEEAN